MIGEGFGVVSRHSGTDSNAAVKAWMGGTRFPLVTVTTDTKLQCIGVQPPWEVNNFDAVIQVGVAEGVGEGLFQYQPPVVV